MDIKASGKFIRDIKIHLLLCEKEDCGFCQTLMKFDSPIGSEFGTMFSHLSIEAQREQSRNRSLVR